MLGSRSHELKLADNMGRHGTLREPRTKYRVLRLSLLPRFQILFELGVEREEIAERRKHFLRRVDAASAAAHSRLVRPDGARTPHWWGTYRRSSHWRRSSHRGSVHWRSSHLVACHRRSRACNMATHWRAAHWRNVHWWHLVSSWRWRASCSRPNRRSNWWRSIHHGMVNRGRSRLWHVWNRSWGVY